MLSLKIYSKTLIFQSSLKTKKIIPFIISILFQIVVGPLINKDSSPEGDINRFKAHEKLRSLNVNIASELDDIKNTTTNIFICNACFLGFVAIVSVFLTAMTIKSEGVWIFYPVILSIVCNLPKTLFLRTDLHMKYLYIKFLILQKY